MEAGLGSEGLSGGGPLQRVVRPLNTIACFVRGVIGHVDSQKYCNSPGELGW